MIEILDKIIFLRSYEVWSFGWKPKISFWPELGLNSVRFEIGTGMKSKNWDWDRDWDNLPYYMVHIWIFSYLLNMHFLKPWIENGILLADLRFSYKSSTSIACWSVSSSDQAPKLSSALWRPLENSDESQNCEQPIIQRLAIVENEKMSHNLRVLREFRDARESISRRSPAELPSSSSS